MKFNRKLTYLAAFVATTLSTVSVNAASVNIENAGFEEDFSNWDVSGSTTISKDEHSGSQALKISSSSGKAKQEVVVDKNTNYVLTAYVMESGKIGATVNGESYSATGGNSDSEEYEKVTVTFNSGDAGSITVFASYNDAEGRFDDFVLESTGSESTGSENSSSVTVDNAGFEDDFSDWSTSGSPTISEDEHSGSKALKISSSKGKVEQDITVVENTSYELIAYVQGSGEIGAKVNGDTYSATGGNSGDDNYEKVSVPFNSGSADSITIFATYHEEEGRFDDFSLLNLGSTTEEPVDSEEPIDSEEPVDAGEVCLTSEALTILSATDDGTYQANHGPEKSIDGNTTDVDSRWASDGVFKYVTYDLGEEVTVKELAIKWWLGTERSAYFQIETSVDNVTWSPVYSGGISSGADSDFETIDVIDSSAQYVKVVGFGNSSGSNWNSIIETQVLGCSNVIDEPIEEPVDEPVDEPIDEPVDEPIDEPVDEPVDPEEPVVDNICTENGQITLNGECAEWLDIFEAESGKLDDDAFLISSNPVIVTFDALAAQHVTENGGGWRHELKVKSSGDYRVPMTEVYELFKATITANLSDGAKTIVAQHHAETTKTITKLYIADLDEKGFENAPDGTESDSVAMNGIFDVYIRLAKEDGSGETKHLLTTIRSGESFYFEEENDHGVVTVKINGVKVADSISVEDSSESYFKFGNYQQAQYPEDIEDEDIEIGDELSRGDEDGDWAELYEKYFDISEVTFTNLSYTRTLDNADD